MLPPLSEHALLPYCKEQYNADFYYVGGAMANTFPMMMMMRKATAGHAIKPPVGYFT